MKRPQLYAVLICIAAAGALALRLPRLGLRPMHTDEAVQAVKSGELLQTGTYVYDSDEYHGPILQYVTVPFMWISSGTDWAATTEATYRIVPVLFGAGLVLLLFLVTDGIGRYAAVVAGLLTAISPAMTYYSRYYIHETLLVFFTFCAIAAAWRYTRTKSPRWAIAVGVFIGLMHATKETCVVAFAAMGLAVAGLVAWRKWVEKDEFDIRSYIKSSIDKKTLLYALGAAAAVSFILFSSFLTNLRGPIDSILTYETYLGRGTGATTHVHPWYYYIKMLLYTKYGRAPLWSEGLILALFLAGAVASFTRRGVSTEAVPFLRFMSFYAMFVVIIYSLIPYKTPWCMISFVHAMIVVAGFGAVAIVRMIPSRYGKGAAIAVMALLAMQLFAQTWRTTGRFQADRRNPYVYAHTSTDLLRLVERVEQMAEVAPDGHEMLIRVIVDDPWPLPWYLRRFTRVGYWQTPPEDCDAAIVIVSTENAEETGRRLSGEYQKEYFGHRPEVHLLAMIRSDLWERFMQGREGVRIR